MTRSRHRLWRWLPAATALLCLALLACTENYPRSSLAPTSDFARMIDDLFETITIWGLVVFVLVEALLVWIIVRFRRRPGDEEHPHPVHGHTRLEIAWTMVPALILVFIAVPTVRTIFVTQDERPVPGALTVRVIGHQWWWEFEYPDLEIVTANELHIPVGRTTQFDLQSADVIHSFWIPRLGGKRDMIPPHTNRLWFTPDSTGTFVGQCGEFCGHSHALMGMRVVVETAEGFDAWVANQRRPAVGAPAEGEGAASGAAGQPAGADTALQQRADTPQEDPRVAAGVEPADEQDRTQTPAVGPEDAAVPRPQVGEDEEELEAATTPEDSLFRTFFAAADPAQGAKLAQGVCAACHTIQGTTARGRLGPNLTHVASRQRIAAELLPNRPEALARWLRDPPALKPGAKMPDLNLTEDQIADLVAYLTTLK